MAKGKKRSYSKARMRTAWYRQSQIALFNPSGGNDAITLMALASPMYDDFGGTALDFGMKDVLKILRIIAKIVIVLTSTGVQQTARLYYGFRLDEVDNTGSLRAAGLMPSVLTQSDDSRREDWLWRGSSAATIPATLGAQVQILGEGGQPTVSMDFKPNRGFGQRLALVLHHRLVLVGTASTSPDVTFAGDVDLQMLLGKR